METLSNDLLMVITKKVFAFGTQDLLNFVATSKLHHQLANKKAAFKALNRECLCYIVGPTSLPAKRRFVRRLFSSGHPSCSEATTAFMLHQICPDLEIIKQVLVKAMKHGSDGATYFNLMLEFLAADNLLDDQIILVFQDLFNRRQLANYHNAILNTAGPHFALDSRCFHPMLPGLRYQFSCPPCKLYNGIRRIRNIASPFPGSDEDYPRTNFCLSCRLDLELDWFLRHFRFLDLGFLW